MNNEKEKLLPGRNRKIGTTASVQYVPPDDVDIERFTKKVCDALVKAGHNEFGSKNICWNVTSFLKLVAELKAKQMNEDQVKVHRKRREYSREK